MRVVSHLLGVDTKRLHYFHEMFHAEHGHRVAAQELIGLHIDLRIRRVAPFPPELSARLQEMRERVAISHCRKAWDGGSRCQVELTAHHARDDFRKALVVLDVVIGGRQSQPDRARLDMRRRIGTRRQQPGAQRQ